MYITNVSLTLRSEQNLKSTDPEYPYGDGEMPVETAAKLLSVWVTLAQSVEQKIPKKIRSQIHLFWSLETNATPRGECFFRAEVSMARLVGIPTALEHHLISNRPTLFDEPFPHTYAHVTTLKWILIATTEVGLVTKWTQLKPRPPEAMGKIFAAALVNGWFYSEDGAGKQGCTDNEDLLHGIWTRSGYQPSATEE